MSTDGGLQWYWVLIIVLAVTAISGCLCLIWCCRRPKSTKPPPSPVPTSPYLNKDLNRPHPLPECSGLYRPSMMRQRSHSLWSQRLDTYHPNQRRHSLPEWSGLYQSSNLRGCIL
ncbi:hypothetical protein DPMN_088057 [Dreissena polymorpha]|uniref:Uncharacterized protein n=1 Tax=Dreissena polymorpha TaxID=45954 RepID=A0A9D4KU60_DREPO|nr:hypothetical protein DPMN_088057 [Dreissena polymorpha]